MKKIIAICSFVLVSFASNAEDAISNAPAQFSEFVAGLVPGEGLTEVNIQFKQKQEPDFSILAVRDIEKTETSNFFSQLSIGNYDVGGDERYIANLGFGHRTITSDDLMIGANIFYDADLNRDHRRLSFGFEAKGPVLDFNINRYLGVSKRDEVSGVKEQSLGGIDYNLVSQVPNMPWATIKYTGYKHYADKGSSDISGSIYSLGMAVTPSLQVDFSRDESNHEDGDVDAVNLSFIYPPRDNKPTLADGFTSDEVFYSVSLEDKLSDKVERNNNLVIEIQGAVIFTKK